MAQTQKIYIVGICGTGTGALAGMLKAMGHEVLGSDTHIYPPMSDRLAQWGVPILEGFDAAHIPSDIDQVIIGNVIRRDNPEAAAIRQAHLPTMSMPEAIAKYCIQDRHSVVIAGTHGKTTTTALTAHLLLQAKQDPGFLVGGAPVGLKTSFHQGQGPLFVIEGDEYDSAYFDKGPKFLHYRAKTAVITSLEFDHADIFADVDAVEKAFGQLIAQVPSDGRIIVWHGAHRARRLIAELAQAREFLVFSDDPAHAQEVDIGVSAWQSGPQGLTFTPHIRGQTLGPITTSLWGAFGLRNALAALGAVREAHLEPAQLAHGFASFRGVHRRMEVRGEIQGITVVDDFAHHPTAVAETLKAARGRWPNQRLWALFEPRSATARRNIFFEAYAEAFELADKVVIAGHPRLQEIPAEARFEPQQLAKRLGDKAKAAADAEAVAHIVRADAHAGDIVLVLSNGSFDGLIERLLAPQTPGA